MAGIFNGSALRIDWLSITSMTMPLRRERPDQQALNEAATLPYNLRLADFEAAIRDVYDFFFDVNKLLRRKNLERLDDTVRPAIMSGLLSDMITASLAKHSRSLVVNKYFNGHPDLVVKGEYPNDSVQSGSKGVEVKTTRKAGGAVDFHGARDQWLGVFVYEIDETTEPAVARRPLRFTEIYLGQVRVADFRRNERGELGTRTATLHREGIAAFRKNWIYRLGSDDG